MLRVLVGFLLIIMILVVLPVEAQVSGERPVITAENIDDMQPIYEFSGKPYRDLAWSPDGSQLALGGEDGVWLVDMTALAPEPVHFLEAGEFVYSLAYHPEKSWLAVGYTLDEVKLFDTLSGELIAEFPEHVWTVLDVAFSPDGSLLATSGMDGEVRLLDVESGEIVHMLSSTFEEHRLWFAVAFHPTENAIIGGGDWMQYWDVATGEELGWYLEDPPIVEHPALVRVTCFDFNGEKMLLAVGGPGYGILWNLETGARIDTFGHFHLPVEAVSISADGSLLVAASQDGVVEVWNVGNLTSVWRNPPSDEGVYGAAFSPDQTLLAYATTGGNAVIMGVR